MLYVVDEGVFVRRIPRDVTDDREPERLRLFVKGGRGLSREAVVRLDAVDALVLQVADGRARGFRCFDHDGICPDDGRPVDEAAARPDAWTRKGSVREPRLRGRGGGSVHVAGVGAVAGGMQSALSSAVVELRKKADPSFQPAMKVPSVQQSALGMAATCGIFANARYQIISGFDRYLFENANYLWSYLTLSGLLRTASTAIGEPTRQFMCGLPAPPPMASEADKRMARARAQAPKDISSLRL